MKKCALALLAGVLLLASACSAGPGESPSETAGTETDAEKTAEITRREALCFQFLLEKMINADGGVRTNYLNKDFDAELASGAQVLSESMGLWMLYAVKAGDQALFDRSLGFVESKLDTGVLLSYRYSPEDGAYPVNAFLDDIRIVRALLLAQEAFGGTYGETALSYADRLYGTNVAESRVYDFYDERYGAAGDSVTLCYLDLDTMRMLGEQDKKWTSVYGVMLDVAQGGYLGDGFPLYAGTYSYVDGAYSAQDIVTVQALLTMLNLARVGECPQSSIAYIKRQVENGALYGGYRTDGTAAGRAVATAVYAICAQIGKAAQDEELYAASIAQMDRFQVMDADSEVYGAFADAETLDLYAFDNLMALMAYRG